MLSLDCLELGKNAIIKSINVEGDLLERFRFFGVTKDRQVSVLKRSLGGASMVIHLGSSSIIMRREEACCIEVELIQAD